MARNNHLSTLLVEIMVAVLFFALSATVLLDMFVAARNQSMRAGICNEALAAAQNLADRLYAAADADALLQSEGFAPEGGAWTLDCGRYSFTVTLEEEPTAAGTLRNATVAAQSGGKLLLTLPCARYVPGEVAQ